MMGMTRIVLDRISLAFPVLHTGQRSFKKALVATATGGAILRDSRSAPVVQALKHVSASFVPGDRIGLIGPNGAGKSTLLRVIAGIYEPSEGRIHVEGGVSALLDLGLGFNSDLTGRDNIRLRGMYMGLKPSTFARLVPEIADFTELGGYLDLPVRTYSSGMQMRLSIGTTTAVQPDILLMDEWVMAGDAHFVDKVRVRMEKFVENARILVFASHSEDMIRQWCNKALLLRSGHVVALGGVDEVISQYRSAA
jgi:ABC-type polysaccharide/polyol phosphate transport system ATPase subunit